MPSQLHEALVELFREYPMLAPELLGSVFGVEVSRDESVEIVAASFGEVRPPEYSADLVLTVGSAERRIAIILEVQLDAEGGDRESKRTAWARYAVWQWADKRSPTYLVVVTPSDQVERWASEPIAIGHPGFVLVPLVLGPSTVPVLADPADRERALAFPELAILSAVVHGRGEHAIERALLAVDAALAIEPEKRKLYVDLVLIAMADADQKQVEEIMFQKYEYQSNYARRFVQQGREEGEAAGRAQGKAEGVLRVLEARGLSVPRSVVERVLACRDIATLDVWLARAVTVAEAEAIFG